MGSNGRFKPFSLVISDDLIYISSLANWLDAIRAYGEERLKGLKGDLLSHFEYRFGEGPRFAKEPTLHEWAQEKNPEMFPEQKKELMKN